MDQRDIYRSAKLLITRYGFDAAIHAAIGQMHRRAIMPRLRCITLSVLLMLLSMPVIGAPKEFSVGGLRSACLEFTKYDNGAEKFDFDLGMRCMGFMSGITIGYELGVSVAGAAKSNGVWCKPKGVVVGQMIHVFVNWANNNPELWHEPWYFGPYEAFKETWPCKK